jgi:hypothetical protein
MKADLATFFAFLYANESFTRRKRQGMRNPTIDRTMKTM